MAALQPAYPQQIVHRNQQAAQIGIFGTSRQPGPVSHWHKAHLPALAPHQRDQIAVDMIEIGQLQEGLAATGLQAAARIGGAVGQKKLAKAIAQARGEAPAGLVLALDPNARDQTDFGFAAKKLEQSGNIGRIVLTVAVQGDDDVAAGGQDAAADAAALAKIAGMAQHSQGRYLALEGGEGLKRAVLGAIVDEKNFMA